MTKWDARFLDLAKMVASWSKDPSTQTGAIIVAADRRVISLGYNGFPRKMSDADAFYTNREEKYSRIVHCEMNAVLSAREPVHGATLYTWPFISCDRCAVHMIQAGVTRMVGPMCPPDQATRWEVTLAKTRRYCAEAGVELVEYDLL